MTSVLLSQEPSSVPTGTYSYSSQPRAVPVRKHYPRSTVINDFDDGPIRYGNLMYDRRVVRGNTYAAQPLPWGVEPDPVEIQKRREAHRKMLTRRREREAKKIHTPEPEDLVNRVDVQTELYLEEISDRIIETDVECQTDAFAERPVTPLFIPQKTGSDVATQIEEGELFDFNLEVTPVLQVLVGKCIEQALTEVAEEEELRNLEAHQKLCHELRNAELAEVQRLEEKERRHAEEKKRRMNQEMGTKEQESLVTEKVSARAFALQYLSNLIPSVFKSLNKKGFYYDQTQREVEKGFLPYVMNCVELRIEKKKFGRIMTDGLINDVVQKRLKDFAEYEKLHHSLRQQKRAERIQRLSEYKKSGKHSVDSRKLSDKA